MSHQQQCSELAGDSRPCSEVSKLYGINRNSILNELTYFHVCNGALLPDVLHDILEGALQYEVKLMLKVMVYEDEYFTLDDLNSRLENMELGYMESKDRPTPISIATLRHSSGLSLKQSGMCVNPIVFYLQTMLTIIAYLCSHSCIPPLKLHRCGSLPESCPSLLGTSSQKMMSDGRTS